MMDSRNDRGMSMDDDSIDSAALEQELIEEWCPVCKEIKPHAHTKDNKIACASCNHEHVLETENVAAVQTILTPEDRANAQSLYEAWKRLTDVDDSEVKAYSIKAKLGEGDIVRHAKFGVGIVIEMTDATKAEILFEEGTKRLVCGK